MPLVKFLPGDGTVVMCEVVDVAEFPRGPDGECAFCKGDPIAEYSPRDAPICIVRDAAKHWFECCPFCLGRPS